MNAIRLKEVTLFLILAILIFLVYKQIFDVISIIFISSILAFIINLFSLIFNKFLKNWCFSVYLSIGFILFLITSALSLVPSLLEQLKCLIDEAPVIISKFNKLMADDFIQNDDFLIFNQMIKDYLLLKINEVGQILTRGSLLTLTNLINNLIVFLIIILTSFYLTKEKRKIIYYLLKNLREKKQFKAISALKQIIYQLHNYALGKLLEIMIVFIVCFAFFYFINLRYTLPLSLIVGFSVLVPYVGALLVSIPIFFVGYYQFGFSHDFYVMFIGYIIIQILDGNVLVPILFSKAVDLSPLYIIISLIFFGSAFGIIGAFLAIPIAIVLNNLVIFFVEV